MYRLKLSPNSNLYKGAFMKFLLLLSLLTIFVSCSEDETTKPVYRCEQMSAENKVSGCKIGDWYNFDLSRCNSTEANCQK